eukprot:TRINITY_DN19409_c0_g1_i1.p1 TRINITY_DN19409_c0_g1~~TRINITY_DN19409_c0_g1_i1.p1  ORF type:complete len:113 (+),score=10.06 TRINITY_DN19409_c0_g1_i1:47-385(+)
MLRNALWRQVRCKAVRPAGFIDRMVRKEARLDTVSAPNSVEDVIAEQEKGAGHRNDQQRFPLVFIGCILLAYLPWWLFGYSTTGVLIEGNKEDTLEIQRARKHQRPGLSERS